MKPMPIPSVNRTACKLRLQVRSGLRPPPAGYVERWASPVFADFRCYSHLLDIGGISS